MATSQPLIRNSIGQVSPDLTAGWYADASHKYGVPAPILSGVFGIESNFGADSKTSSAGAVGFMQFLPSTAQKYGYPLTNTPTAAQARAQMNAAAHYLSDLETRFGSWDAALKHYSGGGYGLAQVQAKAGTATPADGAVLQQGIPGANQFGDAVDKGLSWEQSIANFFGDLTSGRTWLRVLEFIGGLALLVFAAVMFGRAAGVSSPKRTRTIPVPV